MEERIIDFLRQKQIVGPNHTEWVVTFPDGRQVVINELIKEFQDWMTKPAYLPVVEFKGVKEGESAKEYVDRVINESIDCSCAEGKQMLHVEITVRREGSDVVREAKVNGHVRWSERVWINSYVKADRPHQFMDEVEQFFNPKDRY